jgi:hypothetical protein
MNGESRQAHWEKVYTSKGENEVSWFQENPAPSLDLMPSLPRPGTRIERVHFMQFRARTNTEHESRGRAIVRGLGGRQWSNAN